MASPAPGGPAGTLFPLGSPRRPTERPSPTSHPLRISWQIGEGEQGVGEGVGTTAVGFGGGPWQDGWWGVVTFQWPDISEQEATTVPPGRRHSSFLSLVQVPGAGEAGEADWGQQSPRPCLSAQRPRAGDGVLALGGALDGPAEGPKPLCFQIPSTETPVSSSAGRQVPASGGGRMPRPPASP